MPLASPRDIVAAIKDYGLKVRERPGWEIRGTGYRFEPIGQAWHHDAISEAWSDAQAETLLANGRTDLRGPLCNDAVDSDSTVVLIAYGNANHAGRNEADVITRLRNGLAPLGDARDDPDGDTVVGNPLLWGHECRNTGTGRDPWEQLDAMERLGAALCDVNGWDPDANAAHRELTARKPDPAGIDMFAFRRDVGRILATHNAPPTEEDDLMFIAKGEGYLTRFFAPPLATTISSATEKKHAAKGVKVLPFEKDEVERMLKQVGQALTDQDVVDAIDAIDGGG